MHRQAQWEKSIVAVDRPVDRPEGATQQKIVSRPLGRLFRK